MGAERGAGGTARRWQDGAPFFRVFDDVRPASLACARRGWFEAFGQASDDMVIRDGQTMICLLSREETKRTCVHALFLSRHELIRSSDVWSPE